MFHTPFGVFRLNSSQSPQYWGDTKYLLYKKQGTHIFPYVKHLLKINFRKQERKFKKHSQNVLIFWYMIYVQAILSGLLSSGNFYLPVQTPTQMYSRGSKNVSETDGIIVARSKNVPVMGCREQCSAFSRIDYIWWNVNLDEPFGSSLTLEFCGEATSRGDSVQVSGWCESCSPEAHW